MVKRLFFVFLFLFAILPMTFASEITQEEDYVVSNWIGIESSKSQYWYSEILTCGQDILNLTNNTFDCRIYYTAQNSKWFFWFPIKTFNLETNQSLMKHWIPISSNEYLTCIINSNKCFSFNQETKTISDYTLPSITMSNVVKINNQLAYIEKKDVSCGELNINNSIKVYSDSPTLIYSDLDKLLLIQNSYKADPFWKNLNTENSIYFVKLNTDNSIAIDSWGNLQYIEFTDSYHFTSWFLSDFFIKDSYIYLLKKYDNNWLKKVIL